MLLSESKLTGGNYIVQQ